MMRHLPFILTMLPFVGMARLEAASPLLSSEDAAFFHDQAMRIVRAARVAPGGKSGDKINTTPYAITLPDSGHAYMALWPRDSNMSLGADFVLVDDIQGWIKLMTSIIPSADWQVRPGIKVPAYVLNVREAKEASSEVFYL